LLLAARPVFCRQGVQEVLRMLRDDSWIVVATRGSHRQLEHPEKRGA
jgi:predicted RNA binding protein YcfA (HicA-like mRNA interferase family)